MNLGIVIVLLLVILSIQIYSSFIKVERYPDGPSADPWGGSFQPSPNPDNSPYSPNNLPPGFDPSQYNN